jgi:hypothetical protein
MEIFVGKWKFLLKIFLGIQSVLPSRVSVEISGEQRSWHLKKIGRFGGNFFEKGNEFCDNESFFSVSH